MLQNNHNVRTWPNMLRHNKSSVWLLICAALLLLIWSTSLVFIASYSNGNNWKLVIGAGAIGIIWGEPPGWPNKFGYDLGLWWEMRREYDDGILLLFPDIERLMNWHSIAIPLWPIALAALYIVVRNGRRLCRAKQIRNCYVCYYDLRGNVSGRCPECGTPISSSIVANTDSTNHTNGAY